MSTGKRLPLHRALSVADDVCDLLAPACTRIEIAGSIRRRRPDVGDIEIVAVPVMRDMGSGNLFGPSEPVWRSVLDARIGIALQDGALAPHPERPANGERYKRLWLPEQGIQLDLFIVREPAEWGPIFAIRTGPASYSRSCVTALHRKGWRCTEGRVLDDEDEHVPCPEEEDFFRACWVMNVAPERRGYSAPGAMP